MNDKKVEITGTMFDNHPDFKRKIKVKVSFNAGSIFISPKGYKDGQGGEPVMLELYEDKLRVIVWSDPEVEDPTHVIHLEKTRTKKTKNS